LLELSPDKLVQQYGLKPVEIYLDDILAGDLLVYRGHVVIVERVHERGVADIIHATGGKDLKVPGQGIQRERFVRVANFRGPLLRILRHVKVDPEQYHSKRLQIRQGTKRHVRLRPVERKQAD
jgi:hypothetical protein